MGTTVEILAKRPGSYILAGGGAVKSSKATAI